MTIASYDSQTCKRGYFENPCEDEEMESSSQKKIRTLSQNCFEMQHNQGLHFSLATFLAAEDQLFAKACSQRVEVGPSDAKMAAHDDPFLFDEQKTLSAVLDPDDSLHRPSACDDHSKKNLLLNIQAFLVKEIKMPAVEPLAACGAYALPKEMPLDFLPSVIPFANGVVHISKMLGSGVYGQVYHAQFHCSKTKNLLEVALKINRVFAEKTKTLLYRESLVKEADILFELSSKDEEDSMPVARFVDSYNLDEQRFFFLQKLCSKDLYTILKQTKRRGISFHSLCYMTVDLLKGLKFLQDQNPPILHADIKPDNIMRISDDSEKLRIVDFSVSMRGPQRNLRAQNVVSLFYRPPEVVLGCPYDEHIDNWAVACVLFEMFSAKPLFPAKDNNELLCMFLEFLGPIPSHYALRSTSFKGSFIPSESLKNHVELIPHMRINEKWENRRSYFERKLAHRKDMDVSEEDLLLFKDFILKALAWDPDERPSVAVMFKHPFYILAKEMVTSGIDVT
jgi:serine/threonine protein kinase